MTRLAIVNKHKCNPKKCSKECAKYCPMNRTGASCVVVSDKSFIDETLCTGCGICIKKCPFEAISIINLPEALKEKPVYRYGENEFELFRLPIPHEGKVVGMIGANGTGKTTALEILSNLLKPNFGDFNADVGHKEIIEFFRGSELQKYFSKLLHDDVKVAYKPQYVDLIPDKFKGKAIELLEHLAPEKKVLDIAKKLGIDKVLSRKVDQLSGGELQKVAIAATILKDSDLYFFDEPASYLDVKERIRVARIINELAESGKAVIVVEHDLIILDYLSDLIHILYGTPACYGVVSHPLSAKNGVNSYLEGFLRDENIRFRNEPLKFEHHLADKKTATEIYMAWPDLQKKLGTFSLSVEESVLYKKEVVGIVGANATGKTTFARILAGEMKPDKGTLAKKIKIAYKPQYIKPIKGTTVLALFASISKEFLGQKNKIEILAPLQVEHLLNKPTDELSGGELQRVAIAACLLREADLYLLDEPSTYLDVEQRLQAARCIQKVVKEREASALVIDHDLLFINCISDRIMVFDGTPALKGHARKISQVKEGMNFFLKELDITLRKDAETQRPRVNKAGSQLDREQKQSGEFYA